MPIFFQQNIDDTTSLAVWKIEEEEDFFLRHAIPQRQVHHPHKKLQHLAGRYLLKWLRKDFPLDLIRIADTRKPFLQDEAYHFSISHCSDLAAVIVSSRKRVGVDIELVSEKTERIRHKFLSGEEERVLEEVYSILSSNSGIRKDTAALTLAWSCKEAVFKWYGWGKVDFRKHMVIERVRLHQEQKVEVQVVFRKGEERTLIVHAHAVENTWLSYVIT